ncbi:MAG: DUF6134 family protein [Alphaproteobacteria bacterium]|nr:DUF6134 family protein [Alphaproteobacteria bacterium]
MGPALAPASASSDLAALPEDPGTEIYDFHVFMNGRMIGDHIVRVDDQGDATSVEIDIALEVGLGPFTLYSYDQEKRALWRDGELQSFRSVSDNDGDAYIVEAQRTADGDISVVVNGADPVLTDVWFPTSYWNKETVEQSKLLATLDGEVQEVSARAAGWQFIPIQGSTRRVEKFELRGDLDIDLWYDEEDKWVRLAFNFKGNEFVYELQ